MATILPEEQVVEMTISQQEVSLSREKRTSQKINNSSTAITTEPVPLTILHLPSEILTHILLHLPFTSVLTCQGVSHRFRVLISESVELQYYTYLGISGLVDNPHCNLTLSERLSRLMTRARRFEEFKPDFDKIVKVPFRFRLRHAQLSGGIFAMLSTNAELRFMQVPRIFDHDVKWREVLTGQKIIATGLSIHDHDLYVLVTAQPRTVNQDTANPRIVQEVQVRLSRLSTGEPHPDVRKAIISFETREEFLQPHAITRHAGDSLLLVLCDRAMRSNPDDQVYIYEWKTGKLKLRLSAPSQTYDYPLFLTTDIFVLPSRKTGELEYWRIPEHSSEPTPNQPFFVLSLPQCRSGRSYRSLLCRAEPSPGTRSRDASKPSYDDPHQAITIFIIEVQSLAEFAQRTTSFLLFVHRNSLVGCLKKFPAFTSFYDRPQPVPYDEWGPPICRWFNTNQRLWLATTFGQRCIAPPPKVNTKGAPLTLLDFNPVNVAMGLAAERRRVMATTLDNEDRNIAHNEYTDRASEDNAENGLGCGGEDREMSPRTYKNSAPEVLPHLRVGQAETKFSPFAPRLGASVITRSMDPLNDPNDCFENTVYSSLPYTTRSSQEKYNSNALLLDEESILAIQMNDNEMCITELHVFHYG